MTDIDPTAYGDSDSALAEAKRLHGAGRSDEAERLYRRSIELSPDNLEAGYQLGILYREKADPAAAATLLADIAHMAPDRSDVWLELTRAHHDRTDWPACVGAAERVLALEPECIEAELMRAVALFAVRDHAAATASIERVARILPEDGGVQTFHARCLMAEDRFAEAQIPAQRAAALMPDSPDALYLHGACLKRTGQNETAEDTLTRCLDRNPQHHEALNDLADIYIARGDTQAALACLRRSHAAAPYNLDAISGLCFYTAFDPNADAKALYDINRDWSLRLAAETDDAMLPPPAVARPDNRIRIAYLAYDLFDHVTSWFLEPVLARHDRDRFHVTGYFGNANTDAVTERLGGYVDSWQHVADDTIADTAARVRRDGIDILVLASFFRGKDRRVLAHRAAPIQVGYHNRVASTGLDTVDYIVTECVSDPVGKVERYYTEALVRLTNHNIYLPPPGAPGPVPPPCLDNGYITFGSFNNLAKIGDGVIATWSAILAAVPDARMILRSSIHFDNERTRSYFAERFANHGIDANRLEFQGLKALRRDHLAGIGQADITLDPFPCNGGTTSCESLWMGLPLVTMETDSYMGRQGASYLHKLGLTDLIARTPENYIDIAVRLAADVGRLKALRASLRPLVEREIFDYEQHVRELEIAFHRMFSRHNAGLPPISFEVSGKSVTKNRQVDR